jgi:hypothetical protein
MTATFEPDPAGGQVVVTRFECPTVLAMLAILLLHVRLKRDVRRSATGYLGGSVLRDWRRRTVLNVSLWRDLDSVYSMGKVPRHVQAARVPAKLGVITSCGVFCYVGEWTRVMFGSPVWSTSPLHPREPAVDTNPSTTNNDTLLKGVRHGDPD